MGQKHKGNGAGSAHEGRGGAGWVGKEVPSEVGPAYAILEGEALPGVPYVGLQLRWSEYSIGDGVDGEDVVLDTYRATYGMVPAYRVRHNHHVSVMTITCPNRDEGCPELDIPLCQNALATSVWDLAEQIRRLASCGPALKADQHIGAFHARLREAFPELDTRSIGGMCSESPRWVCHTKIDADGE